MKRIIFVILLQSLAIFAFAQFQLRTGDLLFQLGKNSTLTDAIAEVTRGAENINYTHVGIVKIENGNTFVIEATTPVVRKIELDSFLNESRKINGKPIVAIGRLKAKYLTNADLDEIVNCAETHLGKGYDYVYAPDEKEIYCSELVYISYRQKNGKPIFKSQKMTFRDEDGNMTKAWIAHFEKYKAPIPEGIQGTNPGEMSKSKKLDILYKYF